MSVRGSSVATKRGKVISEAAFTRMWRDPDLTIDQIAGTLGVTRQAVQSRARVRGLETRLALAAVRKSAIHDPTFPAMWNAKVRLCDLVAYHEVSHTVVFKTAARLGLPPRGRNKWNTITIEQFREAEIGSALAASAASTRQAMKDRAQ